MQQLALGMLQWIFSPTGLIHFVSALLLAWAAARSSPQGSVARFLLAALLVCGAAWLLGALEHERQRHLLAWSLWIHGTLAVYVLVLGVMVARKARQRPILLTAAAIFVLLAPLSWLSAIYLECYVGHDCP